MATKPSRRREDLVERVRRLPTGPGVYLFKDEPGRVLYVGKATNLRARVRSYVNKGDGRPLVTLLMRRAADVDVVTTETPEAALLLENTLIKQHRPPYNLRLKDDKAYLLVRIDKSHPFPQIRLVRKVKKDGAQYVGPFASAKAVRRTVRFLRTLYPLRSCSDRELEERTKPCLYHQIGRCAAPCVDLISQKDYAELVDGTLAVLRGRDSGLLGKLRRDMAAASDALQYERAAILRDRAEAIERALAQHETFTPDGKDRDVVAVASAGGVAMLGLVYVRDGCVVATRTIAQRTTLGKADVIYAFLSQFYLRGKVIPGEVLVEAEPEDLEGLTALLTSLRGGRVMVRRPQRGKARELIAMALGNAEVALSEHSARVKQMQEALGALGEHLGLDAPPYRIEGYDLSHLGGADPVAGMSVLIGGVPETSSYRHFAIREAEGGDDYAGMQEVVRRRFVSGKRLGSFPDLVLIDGGRGQVAAARKALGEIGLGEIPVIGLAKARASKGTEERIIVPGRDPALVLPP
ncbi:MAG: excinuclease ABC subunit UvrC, partial [Planctomycetota bacterium]|nr:excinuclease ABC subunit UvrC [Planctomycetota bacterium]